VGRTRWDITRWDITRWDITRWDIDSLASSLMGLPSLCTVDPGRECFARVSRED